MALCSQKKDVDHRYIPLDRCFPCYTVVMRYKVYDVQREVFPGLNCRTDHGSVWPLGEGNGDAFPRGSINNCDVLNHSGIPVCKSVANIQLPWYTLYFGIWCIHVIIVRLYRTINMNYMQILFNPGLTYTTLVDNKYVTHTIKLGHLTALFGVVAKGRVCAHTQLTVTFQ